MNQAEDRLSLLGPSIFHLTFETCSKKVAIYDAYLAAPEPRIQIFDLGLRVREIALRPFVIFLKSSVLQRIF